MRTSIPTVLCSTSLTMRIYGKRGRQCQSGTHEALPDPTPCGAEEETQEESRGDSMSDASPATYTRGPCGHVWFMAVDGPDTAGDIAKEVRHTLKKGGTIYHSSV